MLITIDGPAGTGKTTVAKNVAEEVGYTYFDTGAMYRTLAWGVIAQEVPYHDPEKLKAFLERNRVSVKSFPSGEKQYLLNGENVTRYLRTNEVTGVVSKLSAIPMVREALMHLQRGLASGVNAVFEGRDMGTVIFPDADVKVFLTADARVRAQRRYDELITLDPANRNISFDQVLREITERDARDASRDIAPMVPAADAAIIDTSNLTVDEVVNRIILLKEQAENQKGSHISR